MYGGRAIAVRRGMTFIEVVVALVLLSGLAVVVLGSVQMAANLNERQRLRLEATEIAHRVVLQYIDDFELLERQPNRVEHNGTVYVFLAERYIVYPNDGTRRKPRRADEMAIEEQLQTNMQQLLVTVYREVDGVVDPTPLAKLERVFSPFELPGERGMVWLLRHMRGDGGGG